MKLFNLSALALTAAFGMTAAAQAQTPVTPVAPAAGAAAPAVVIDAPEGYVFTEVSSIAAGDLKGVKVFDAEGNDVASIADVVIGATNGIEQVITDVGGFLGIGEHRVALSPSQVQLYKNTDNDLRAYVTLTKDELKALPKYEAAN